MIFKIAVIEDNEDTRDAVIRDFEITAEKMGIEIEIIGFENFNDFQNTLEYFTPDILHFDLNLNPGEPTDQSGWDAIRLVMNNEFTPSILYSAHDDEVLPGDIKDLYVIRIPKSGSGQAILQNAMKKTIEIKNNYHNEKLRILEEFKKISLNSFKTLLPYPGNTEFDDSLITQIAVARVISVLKNDPPPGHEKIPPETMFLIPSLDVKGEKNCVLQGDIIKQTVAGSDSIFLVSTPACDLFEDKDRKRNVNKVLLLNCYKTKEEFKKENPDRNELSKNNIGSYIRTGACHLIKCPKLISENGFLLIVFKNYKTIEFSTLQEGIRNHTITRLATIATPFAENIQNLFIADLSRVGTPDIEKDDDKWQSGFINQPARTHPPVAVQLPDSTSLK